MNNLKERTAGAYVLLGSAVLNLVALAAYGIFGLNTGTFVAEIFALLLVSLLLGVLRWFYRGFFADYIPPVCAALVTASLLRLIMDSIDDFTAFVVGMGNYFGNADNAGPRVGITVIMLLSILTTIVGSFFNKEKKVSA
jgi:hypothetical protein